MDGYIDLCTDSLELAVDIVLGEAQHRHTACFDGSSACLVVCDSLGGEVLGTVELDDQTGLFAVEICNELTEVFCRWKRGV